MLPAPVRTTARKIAFDSRHAAVTDPWRTHSSHYEQSKRHQLVAAVQAREGNHILEVGCSIGANLLALGKTYPTARVTGIDISELAVKAAQNLTRHNTNVRCVHITSTADTMRYIGEQDIDIIVLSEVLYYLGGKRGMHRELEPLRPLLRAGSKAVLVHSSADASGLHRAAIDSLGLNHVNSSWHRSGRSRTEYLVTVAAAR